MTSPFQYERTRLIPPFCFIEEPVPSQECVLRVSIVDLSVFFLVDFVNINPTVWYFFHFIVHLCPILVRYVGSNSSYKPITNTAWVHALFCRLQKRCTWIAAPSDQIYQLLVQGRWSPWYSWNIAESGVKHQKSNQIKSIALR